jgi:chromosome segregation ATPase
MTYDGMQGDYECRIEQLEQALAAADEEVVVLAAELHSTQQALVAERAKATDMQRMRDEQSARYTAATTEVERLRGHLRAILDTEHYPLPKAVVDAARAAMKGEES